MESTKGNIEQIKEQSTSASTVQVPKIEVNAERYTEFKTWEKKAVSEYKDFLIAAPEDLLEAVPESLRDEVKVSVKNEIITLEKQKAKEKLIDLNSPFKYRRIAEVKLDYRNLTRQLAFNKARLIQMVRDNEDYLQESKDVIIKRFEVEYLIDKLKGDLELLDLELELYCLKKEDVLEGI